MKNKEEDFLKYATPDVQKRLIFIAMKYDKDNYEDMAQEALMVAWENFEKFGSGSFVAWVAQIIRFIHLNNYRKSKLARFSSIDKVEREAPAIDNGISEDLRFIMNKKLSDKQQEIIWLADWYGLTYAEAAKMTGIPVGSVMSRLNRARLLLRTELAARA